MKKVAAYVRVSHADQHTAGQEQELQRWLAGNGIDQTEVRWFIDHGASGDDMDRPAFEKLQAAIFNGEIQTVVVWKLDRLSRNLRDGINTLADWCDRGLRVVSATQQLDFNGVTGKLIASVLFAVAEMEQQTRRERQKAGIDAAKSRGVYKGRQTGATKRGVNPERAVELRNRGLTLKEIGEAMGVSISTARRYCLGAE